MTTLVVHHLPSTVTESDVYSFFEDFGPVNSVQIVRGGRSPSLAYVELADESKADDAMRVLYGETLGGRHVTIGTTASTIRSRV